MSIQRSLSSTISRLSDQNYDQSFAFYRFWFDIAHTHSEIPPDQILDTIWDNRGAGPGIQPGHTQFIHSTAFLVLRFAGDAESDSILGPHSVGLRSRLCTRYLKQFFEDSMMHVEYPQRNAWGSDWEHSYGYATLVAHLANLGYVDESVIRGHILQSLTSHQQLYNHQADALVILFELAGATFEKYADPSVVDRCFELLEGHCKYDAVKGPPVQVRVVLRNEGL